jgi:hypothetical protein
MFRKVFVISLSFCVKQTVSSIGVSLTFILSGETIVRQESPRF